RAASHYERPLPAESISQLEEGPISVREVVQPFYSSHGLPQELPEAMYIRAGERIRHKNRALTQWDYERLVINQFANVYKVRCLSSDHIAVEEPGLVKVVVIPDLRGKTPFDPLQPKLPSSQLASIQNYLEQYCPPSANLQVVNPRYVQVRVRFAVRIRPGYSEELSQEELQTAVKRFLSPWAFEEGHEITFGGEIYANALVGYVETLPYVDYVARVRLFSSESGDKFLAVRDTDGMYRVSASEADQILVSADSHDIDLIGDAGYELSSFAGIEHDKIELDFQVGDD
ncbi:MAG TPA: hypothetical protein DCE41_37345, partial [Cytophagales bacterium]|nr:hypothetical protein [Cytophagales bacterium]